MAEISDIAEVSITVEDGVYRFWVNRTMSFTIETSGAGVDLVTAQNGVQGTLLSIGEGEGIALSIVDGELVITNQFTLTSAGGTSLVHSNADGTAAIKGLQAGTGTTVGSNATTLQVNSTYYLQSLGTGETLVQTQINGTTAVLKALGAATNSGLSVATVAPGNRIEVDTTAQNARSFLEQGTFSATIDFDSANNVYQTCTATGALELTISATSARNFAQHYTYIPANQIDSLAANATLSADEDVFADFDATKPYGVLVTWLPGSKPWCVGMVLPA